MSQSRLLGGRYQLGSLLGYGGMAEVHRGRDLRLGRDVAIKTLRTDLARDATFQLRFRREAQNAAALNHPAIVAVYDTGDDRGPNGEELPFIVMEFVNGHTLKEVLTAEGRLTPRRALEIVADICSALEFSHRHGIIHRDIKPGNVMLTQTGQVKVMDFGIARALASGATTMTQTSAVIGTAQYLSPEQARGEPVDARSDVYATGCVLFELLCGRPPFIGDNPVSVAYQHVREDAKPPSLCNREVTPDLDAIVLKALAKNPLNRYQSAGEMRMDLMRAVAGRPVSAPPVLTEDQMAAMIEPQPRTRQPNQYGTGQRQQVPRPPQRKRKNKSSPVAAALIVLGILAVTALSVGLYLYSHSKKTVPVPSVEGLAVADASNKIINGKLRPDQGQQVSGNCTAGSATNQAPKPGEQIREGETVRFDVCIGPNKVAVPSLKGKSKDAALQELTKAGLKPVAVDKESAEPAGTVVDSNPPANATVDKNTQVTIYVSKFNLRFAPDLSGKDLNEAKDTLQQIGFTGGISVIGPQNTTDPSMVDKVVSQDPSAGTPKAKNTTFKVYLGQMSSDSSNNWNTKSPSGSASPSAG